MFPLFHGLYGNAGNVFHDLGDEFVEDVHRHQADLIVDPVGFPFMETLYYFVVSFLTSFVVILEKIGQIALLKVSAHPVALGRVSQQTITFKHSVFEFSHVKVSIFEQFLAKTVEKSILHVASFEHSQLELVFVTMSVWVIASVAASEEDAEGKSVHDSSLYKADCEFVSVLLSLDVVCFFDFVADCSLVLSSNDHFQLCQVKDLVEEGDFCLLAFFEKDSFSEHCVREGFCSEVNEGTLSFELLFGVEEEECQEAIGAIDGLYEFSPDVLGGEEAVLGVEDVVAMEEVVAVGGKDGEAAVVEKDSSAVFSEVADGAHVHGVAVVAEVELVGEGLLGEGR